MASVIEIAMAMKRLTDAMPPPRGVDPAKAVDAYTGALSSYTFDEIDEGISRYMRGECDEKISLKFYPRPPELGKIVRGVRLERSVEAEKGRRAERLAQERAAVDEGLRLAQKTPEQKARASELVARYKHGLPVVSDEVLATMPLSFKVKRRWADAPDEPLRRKTPAEEEAARAEESASVRAKYGMTDEAVAAVADARLVKAGLQKLLPPPLPVPASRADDDDKFEF